MTKKCLSRCAAVIGHLIVCCVLSGCVMLYAPIVYNDYGHTLRVSELLDGKWRTVDVAGGVDLACFKPNQKLSCIRIVFPSGKEITYDSDYLARERASIEVSHELWTVDANGNVALSDSSEHYKLERERYQKYLDSLHRQ